MMKGRYICTVITLSTLVVSGCRLTEDLKYRDCSAFNHPALQQWQPAQLGSTLVYTGVDGGSANYVVTSINSSEPYVAGADFNGNRPDGSRVDSVLCLMSSTHILSAEDESHEIVMEFTQGNEEYAEPAQDGLGVKVKVNSIDKQSGEPDRLLSDTPTINLSHPDLVFDYERVQSQFFDSKTLENGQTYSDVIVITGGYLTQAPELLQFALDGFILARNAGLIQLSRPDGSVLTTVPD